MSAGPVHSPMQVLADPQATLRAVTDALAECEKALADAPVVRVGIAANVTLDLLGPYLRRHAFLENVRLQVENGGYDDLAGDMERFAAADVDAVLVVQLFDNLLPSFEAQIATLAHEAIAAKLAEFTSRIELALSRGSSLRTILLARLHRMSPALEPAAADRVAAVLADFNAALAAVAARFPNVALLDIDAAIASVGAAHAFDWRFYFRGKAPYTIALCNEVARNVIAATRAFGGYFRKVLVVDCDNTLWGGVIGEDLLEGIALDPFDYPGNVYWRIQHAIAALERRGVLICLCSKNNAADVAEVFARHPHMVLADRAIVARMINWDDKVANLRRLAAELDVGLDSFVLLDDSEFECGLVREQLPMVRTVQVPAALADYPRAFAAIERLFLAGGVAAESTAKTAQYRTRAAAQAERVRYTAQDDYLRSLELKVTLSRNAQDRIARIAELTRKSNQFNVTTRRYSEAQIRQWMQDPDAAVYSFAVNDKFGDAGLTGVVIVAYSDITVTVDTFLMSCRVIGRGVEAAVWTHVMAAAAQRGAQAVRAEYVPTAKNAQVADFYERMGLQPVGASGPARHYQSELARLPALAPAWIEVIDA